MEYATLNNGVKMPMAGTGDWKDGERFHGGASQSDISEWIDSLK